MAANPHRRRNYLINKGLQLRYACYIFTTLVLVSLASQLCFSFGVWSRVVKDFSEERISNRLHTAARLHEYDQARHVKEKRKVQRLAEVSEVGLLSTREKELLRENIQHNNLELAIKIALLFIFIALGTIYLTHKIAGPLFRLRKTFQEIKDGDLTLRVHLRRTDHVRDIVPYLNSMIGSLDYSLSKVKALFNKTLSDLAEQGVPTDILNQYTHDIQQELNRYKTSDVYKI